MRVWTVIWMAATACLIGPLAMRCDAQVTLAWNPSATPNLSGYNVCWGTNSGIYIYTNHCANIQTNVTISNLATNEVFFFAVQSVASNGLCSVFSNEAIYTNGIAAGTNSPPFPPGTNSPISPVNTNIPVNVGNSNITQSAVMLMWNPSAGPNLAGYNACWGTNSGIYIYTNRCSNTQTSLTISNLPPNQVFYFAVQSVESNGLCSAFSNEAIYTNGIAAGTNSPPSLPGTNSPTFPIYTNVPISVGSSNITQSAVVLMWNPSAGPNLAGYNACWGTNSGIYLYTNRCANTQTSLTISNLAANEVFFFAVQSVDSNGLLSAFSNEAEYTNGIAAGTNSPPFPPGTTPPILPINTNIQVNSGNSNGGGANSNPPSSTNITQSTFWGIPPFLGLVVSNDAVSLSIGGTVGAALTIMGTTNYLVMDSWIAVTNVTMSNIAPVVDTSPSGQTQDVLDMAFVPGLQTLALNVSNAAQFQYFRVVMPYDYIILADQVLPGKGYTPRLIVVNMPGIVSDDTCYVNETGSFIHYTRTNSSLQLLSSDSTIRRIAGALAESLHLDWTSASEFSYSNGMGQILATVVETESPASDPVAGQNPPGPPIVIDF